MADKKISALTAATLPLAGTEVLPIVQSGSTVKVATDDLTVKNVRSNATTGLLQVAGPGAGTTRVMTTPNANFTAARTDAAQSFTGDQTFGTGNLIQGTAAKGFNFTANTPASGMTSQLLNWYEEGTWSPTVNFGAGNTGMTVTTSGHYTRVGRLVTVRCTVSFTAKGSSTGTFRILGLPFNANTPGAGVMGFNYAWTTMPSGGVSFLATSDSIYAMAANSGSYMDDTYFGNSTVMNDITITYMV